MLDEPKHRGFWSTVPGLLMGLAAIVSAATGLYLATRPTPQPQPRPQPHQVDPTPSVVVPAPLSATPTATASKFTGPMGPLEHGLSYNGGDIYDQSADTPEACVHFCTNDDRCRAVTFIISQKRCWVKNQLNASAQSGDMISARKQP